MKPQLGGSVITRARLMPGWGPTHLGELVDITLSDEMIADIRPSQGQASGNLDADGAVVLPGLWDAHTHFSTHATVGQCVDLTHTSTPAEVLTVVAAELDPAITLGFGFRAGTWETPPTAAELDQVATTPIALISGDMHSVWCNTAGLALAGAPSSSTGYLIEEDAFSAMLSLMRSQTSFVDNAVATAIADASRLGLVGIVDMEMGFNLEGWLRRSQRGALPIRVEAASYIEDLPQVIEHGWRTGDPLTDELTVGPLKIFADGSMSTKTAYCIDEYANPLPHFPHGKAAHSDEELVSLFLAAHQAGLEVAIHGIGDLAVRHCLDAFAATEARGSIEHAQLIADEDLPRFADLGIVASMQPAHLIDDAPALPEIWPTAGDRVFAFRSLLDAGATLSFGSDAPVAPLDPWLAMSAAVNREYEPAQALTPSEALRASTRSTIAVGEPADLIVVDRSPEDLLAGRFLGTGVLATFVGGRITHSNGLGSPAP